MILKEIIYRQQLFLLGSAFKILSYFLGSRGNKISVSIPAAIMQKKYFRQNLLKRPTSVITYPQLYSSSGSPLSTQGPSASSGYVMAVVLLCSPVIRSCEILAAFSYHICAFALIP